MLESGLEAILTDLYEQQARIGDDPYLSDQSSNRAVIRRHVRAFIHYRDALQGPRILDWGCRHAPDACLVRAELGDGVELHGCDLDPVSYRSFHKYADLQFAPVERPYELPYGDGMFDTVIGSGVLEHVPNDSLMLTEVHRVLRDDGTFIASFLPNRSSVSELLSRALGKPGHSRRYSKRGTRELFLHHGLEPVRVMFHQVLPTLAGPTDNVFLRSSFAHSTVEQLAALDSLLERIPVLRSVAANILVIAKKREMM